MLVLAALVLLTLDYRQGGEGPVSAVQRGALTVFGPVAEGFATVVRPVGGFLSSIGDLGSLRDQNDALQADLDRLRQQQVSVADLERENAELRAQLAMRERLGYATTGARVIAQPPSSAERSVLIDRGASDGLQPGMAVVDAQGLVGKLTEVTASNARVELLTSPSAQYAVRIAESGLEGLLTGSGARPFRLEILSPEAEIAPGEEVVTRAFGGTSIPDGIPVGVIQEQGEVVTRFLAVRPYVDFTRLATVQILLDAPLQPTDLAEEELIPAPAPTPPVAPDDGLDG